MTYPERKDCKNLSGSEPCAHNKKTRIPCSACDHYVPLSFRILIIKLGAAGDVVRSTPILHQLRKSYPGSEITWVTDFPELIPAAYVDRILKYSWESSSFLSEEKFDLLLSLEKEKAPCALTNKIDAKVKKGFFYSSSGKILPIDDEAKRKWETGIDDGKMLQDTRHYVEELFEICGHQWSGESYILPEFKKKRLLNKNCTVVGINPGAGRRWKTRVLNIKKIKELIDLLLSTGNEVILLGGPEEDPMNKELLKKYNVHYYGVNPIREFMNIVDNCDIIITTVSMTLHLAIGLNKKTILLNNVFNKNEFYLYGNGFIIEPKLDCLACYKTLFDENCPVADCTLLYDIEEIYRSLESIRTQTSR